MALKSSIPLYNELASDYDSHFKVVNRRCYDDLAWERTRSLLPGRPGLIIDAGCGCGRWVPRFLDLGHEVIGIEQSPEMLNAAKMRTFGDRFHLLEGSFEKLVPCLEQADLVIAMGSLQYAEDPFATMKRFASWLRAGGAVCVLLDSLVALVMELFAAGKHSEAFERLATRKGLWKLNENEAEMHLLTSDQLRRGLEEAGFVGVQVEGVLVGTSLFGMSTLRDNLNRNFEEQKNFERQLMRHLPLADIGKQLLGYGIKHKETGA